MIKQREANSWKSVSYAKSITGAQTHTKFPIVLRTTEQSIPTWSVKGNTETSGTPSPSNPVDVVGVGERTAQLYNKNGTDISDGYVDNSYFDYNGNPATSSNHTISEYIDISSYNQITLSGVATTSSSITNVVYDANKEKVSTFYTDVVPKTITVPQNVKYVRLTVSNAKKDTLMLNEGSTAKSYEPYGYKIPITSEGKNLFDKNNYTFSHLYVAGDNKIYSSDTVCAFILNCEPNTTYTVAKMITSRFILWSMANYPEVGGTFTVREADNTATSLTITTGADDHYILFMFEYTNSSQEAVTEQVANTVMYNTHTTTPIYLGSTQTTRQIKKIELKGDNTETWSMSDSTFGKRFSMTLTGAKQSDTSTVASICSHLPLGVAGATYSITNTYTITAASVLYISRDGTYTSVADFKNWLATEYANGTPITLWYAFAPTETATVNEPLMAIGTYADTLSNAAQIPTTSGLNTIDVDTTVKPSEMSLTYDGYKICKPKRKSANLIDVPYFIANMETNPLNANNKVLEYTLKPNTYYTLTSNFYLNYNACWFICLPDTAPSSVTNGVCVNSLVRTIQTGSDGKLWIWGRTVATPEGAKPIVEMGDSDWVMLNEGSTALPYEPYWK